MEDKRPFSKTTDRMPEQFGKIRIIKNLVVMSSSVMLVFTAYDGLSMLQSTMNKDIGTASQAVVYAGLCLSSLILPKYAIKRLGCKAIFLIGATLFVPYVAANFYPTWISMMSSALLSGVGASLFWAAQNCYFNESVALYCTADEPTPKDKTNLNPAGNRRGPEELSRKSSYRRSIGVLSGSNSNCKCVGSNSNCKCVVSNSNCKCVGDPLDVSSSFEIYPESNSNCVRVIAEINSVDDLPETTEIDHLEEYSRKPTVLLTNEEFATTGDLSVNGGTENSFLVVNTKIENEEAFPVTNPSCEYSVEFDCKTEKGHICNNAFNDNHCAEKLNLDSNNLPFSPKIKFKGEIASDVKDIRSRRLNKNMLVVSVISNAHKNYNKSNTFESHGEIINAPPTCVTESRFKVSNSENPNKKSTDLHDEIEVQHEWPNRKSGGCNDVLQKVNNIESVAPRFFGSIGFAFHSAQVWSNLVSYYVLQSDDSSEELSCLCGASFCNAEPECFLDNSEITGDDMRYLLTGISVILAILAVLLVFFLLDPLRTEKEPVEFSLRNLMATYHHCKKRAQLCLVPISLYKGMVQGFYTADFTKAYIACALGKPKVGLITVYYGLACALSSSLSGYLVKYMGRIPIFLLVQLINIAASVFLLVWTPDPEHHTMFYVTAVLLGVVTGILWAQLPAFYGILFKSDEEAAFASYYFFNSLGWFLSFLYSDHLCTSVKIYILLVVSSLGIFGYLMTESMYRTRKDQIGFTFPSPFNKN